MYLGLDVGSVSINAVLIDKEKRIIDFAVDHSGYDHKESIECIISTICIKSNINRESIEKIVATGYGRRNVPDTYKTVTEITCHAMGVHSLFKNAELVIDIGGQDSKVIKLSKEGFVETFIMNDKCSAGTGRFLEVMAGVMKVDLQEFSLCGLSSKKPYKISSTCTVFAESEVISGIAKGVAKEDIIAGIYESIVSRVMSMAYSINNAGEVVLTGGVAKNKGVVEFMRKKISNIKVPFEPQITGALGAALIACQNE